MKNMEFKLEFNPEDVAKKMTEAIVNSTFKEMFSTAVEAECKRLTEGSWDNKNIIQNVVKNYFEITIRQMLNGEYKEQIQNLIRTKINAQRLEELCDKLIDKINVESRY